MAETPEETTRRRESATALAPGRSRLLLYSRGFETVHFNQKVAEPTEQGQETNQRPSTIFGRATPLSQPCARLSLHAEGGQAAQLSHGLRYRAEIFDAASRPKISQAHSRVVKRTCPITTAFSIAEIRDMLLDAMTGTGLVDIAHYKAALARHDAKLAGILSKYIRVEDRVEVALAWQRRFFSSSTFMIMMAPHTTWSQPSLLTWAAFINILSPFLAKLPSLHLWFRDANCSVRLSITRSKRVYTFGFLWRAGNAPWSHSSSADAALLERISKYQLDEVTTQLNHAKLEILEPCHLQKLATAIFKLPVLYYMMGDAYRPVESRTQPDTWMPTDMQLKNYATRYYKGCPGFEGRYTVLDQWDS